MEIGSLGEIVFECSASKILTPDSISFSHGAKYVEHEVQGAAPRLEFISPVLTSSSFNIRLSALSGVSPLEEINKLKEICHNGKAVRFILTGQNLGEVAIESISETWRNTAPNRKGPMTIEAKISIKEYL